MQITGHKTESVYTRYDIVDAADIRKAGAMLETFVSKESQPEQGLKSYLSLITC
jgi:hypothetical protein